MQIYIGGPLRAKKFRDLTLYRSIAVIIKELGFEAYLPHLDTADPDKQADENRIYESNILALNLSAFAVFEVTHPSHGVGMEIQYALSNRIPFLCVTRKVDSISKMIKGSIKYDHLIEYSDIDDLKSKLSSKIGEELGVTRKDHLGRFITLEGIDLTGKSTICTRIQELLKKQALAASLVHDPPMIEPWREMKQAFETKRQISKLSEAFLFLSARLDNYERVIRPSLRRGEIVISDRYIDSWLAYQSFVLRSYFSNNVDRALEFLLHINDSLLSNSLLSLPDLTILVVDDPEETIKRARLRNSVSKYEDIELLKEVQKVYVELASRFGNRFRVIHAEGKNLDEVFQEAYNYIKGFLRDGNVSK